MHFFGEYLRPMAVFDQSNDGNGDGAASADAGGQGANGANDATGIDMGTLGNAGGAVIDAAANAIGIFVLFGAVEFFYYVKRKQDTRFKYNAKFPSEHPSDVFWFKRQNLDNFLRTYLSSIPLWTLCQVLVLWAWANSWGNWVEWDTHWPWLILVTLLVPAIHEVHFFFIHRLIHTPWLYKRVHSVHHNSINPSPWSSLSMHPVEGALYFAEVFWHVLIPSNPVVMMFQLNSTGFGAINGHIGFDKLEITDEAALDSHAYAHYLHHKYFEVNYGAEGLVPLDKWFGYGKNHKPRHGKVYRNFAPELARLQNERIAAFREFKADVDAGGYPEPEHCVPIADGEFSAFLAKAHPDGEDHG